MSKATGLFYSVYPEKCVSVGLIVCNITSYFDASVASILRQPECLELFVFFSHSSDYHFACQRYASFSDHRVTFLSDSSGCIAGLINKTASSFRGSFFAFLRCGDVWTTSALSSSLSQLNKSSKYLLTYGWAEIIDIHSASRRPFKSLSKFENLSGFCNGTSIALSTMVIKRSAWLLLQGFDLSKEVFFELDFVVRAYELFDRRIALVPRFQADIHSLSDENIEFAHLFRLMIHKFRFFDMYGLPALNYLDHSLINLLSNMKNLEELSACRDYALSLEKSFYSDLPAKAMGIISKRLMLDDLDFHKSLELEARCQLVYKSDGLLGSLISCIFPDLHSVYFVHSKGPYTRYCDLRQKYIDSIHDFSFFNEYIFFSSCCRISNNFEQRPFGVNLIGHAFDVFGLGEALRMMARAFIDAKIPLSIVDVPARNGCSREQNFLKNYIYDSSDDCAPYAFNVICMSPSSHAKWLLEGGFGLTLGRYSIGAWFWETSQWPSPWSVLLRFVDSAWPASELIKSALEKDCAINGVVLNRMPFPAEISKSETYFVKNRRNNIRIRYGLPFDKTIFIFGFDVKSRLERKNPMACIRVFNEAFGDPSSYQFRDDVCLVIKTFKPQRESQEWIDLIEIASCDSRIYIIAESLERDDLLSLYASCDVFLSLHRSEGYGLGMAEALQLGLRVVATGYGGNVDFCSYPLSYLVNSRLVPIPRGVYPFADDHYWAEPDLQHAIELCRRVVADLNSSSSFKLSNSGFHRDFSISRIGSLYRQALDQIYQPVSNKM